MSVHTWEDGLELYQIKTLLKWVIAEKCVALCHGTIQCYILDGFGDIFILGLFFSNISNLSEFVFLVPLQTKVKNTWPKMS